MRKNYVTLLIILLLPLFTQLTCNTNKFSATDLNGWGITGAYDSNYVYSCVEQGLDFFGGISKFGMGS